jgi:rRNA-processing protein FCF1
LFHFKGKHRNGHRIKCAVIARQAVDGLDCDQTFEDPSESVREAYRSNGEGKVVLVRPDLYVDYVGSINDVEGLSGWLT